MRKKEQTEKERNGFFWKIKDKLSRYLEMEKKIIIFCCIIYAIMLLLIGHMFNYRLLEEHSLLVDNTIRRELEIENSDWESYLVLMVMISSDGDVLKMFDEDASAAQVLSSASKLDKYKKMIPNIYDIYLYDAHENTIFSTIGMKREMEAGELVTDEFREQLDGSSYGYHKNFLVYDNYENVKAIAHVLYFSKLKGRFLVILEDYQSYCDKYAYCEELTGTDIIVTNGSGEVLVGTAGYPVGSNIREESFFKNRDRHDNVTTFNKVKSVINYMDNGEDGDRTVIAIRPYAQVIGNNPFDSRWLPFYLILGLLVAQMFMMKGWFKCHVEKMRKKLAEKKLPDAEKLYLLEYLENPLLEFPVRIQAFCDERFGVGKKLGFIILKLDTYKEMKEKYSDDDVKLYLFAFNNMFEEIMQENAEILHLRRSKGEILYLYALHEGASVASLVDAAETCREYIHKYSNFDTSYFISETAEQDKMLEKYSEVCRIMEYAFIYGFNVTLLADVMQTENKGNMKNVLKMCDNLGRCIEEGKASKLSMLEEVMDNMATLDSSEVHEAVFRLIMVVATALKKCENGEYYGRINIVLPGVISKLSEARNLKEIQESIRKLLNRMDEAQKHVVEIKKYDAHVGRVQNMIAEKYNQPDLYIETIAAELGVTGKHLGKVYKAVTGDTISHALMNKRLEEAEKLLKKSDMGIREIAVAVGYTEENCNYFSTLFKKKYGKTPSDYREGWKKGTT